MPLLDHFRSPLSDAWPWDGVHANWATKIADQLNAGPLPPDYHAISLIKRGPEEDLFEVQVIRRFGGAHLRGAVELVSPASKDRPSNRRAFAIECASYLFQGVAVVVIDVVTERLANLHAELVQLLVVNGELPWESPTHLYAVAYRVARDKGARTLETWREPLTVGAPLPTLPLWLDPDLSVPLQLEESYQAACTSLRIKN
jgi:hypothetical protein